MVYKKLHIVDILLKHFYGIIYTTLNHLAPRSSVSSACSANLCLACGLPIRKFSSIHNLF